MIQIVLTRVLFAPAPNLPATPSTVPERRRPMATRPVSAIARDWRQTAGMGLAVAGNALGLLLFLASLGLALRLAEVLLS